MEFYHHRIRRVIVVHEIQIDMANATSSAEGRLKGTRQHRAPLFRLKTQTRPKQKNIKQYRHEQAKEKCDVERNTVRALVDGCTENCSNVRFARPKPATASSIRKLRAALLSRQRALQWRR
jgi:multidrug resistance efflux pump